MMHCTIFKETGPKYNELRLARDSYINPKIQWRLKIKVGSKTFISQTAYKTQQSAETAAKRISVKYTLLKELL